MALQFLDKTLIGSYLSAMWKKDLNTGEDPPNGKWYENGANGDGIGLYGGLTDSAATQLQLNESSKQYLPEAVVCDTATLDNLNGLAPSSTVQLSYQYSKGSSTTHSTTDSIKVGVGVDIKASATIFGIGADVTTKFSFDYTHSWSTTTAETESQTYTFSQSVPVNVPEGKVYQVVLTAMSQKLIIPYTATIGITGTTETWFEDRINGHYNWSMDAGSAFANIGAWGLAGSQSPSYSAAGVSQSGTITATQTTQFVAKIYDITATYKPQGMVMAIARSAPIKPGVQPPHPVQGAFVREVAF
jgi:hypothetical protein